MAGKASAGKRSMDEESSQREIVRGVIIYL
jgi:hypothetical protein